MEALLFYVVLSHLLLFTPTTQDSVANRLINRKFGTVSTLLSKVHLNPKPWVIVRRIEYGNLKANNQQLREREKMTLLHFQELNTIMFNPWTGNWNQDIAGYMGGQVQAVLDTGIPFNQSQQRLDAYMQAIQAEKPLHINWSPSILNRTKRDVKRKKRMLPVPIIGAVLSVAKAVAPMVATSVLSHVSEAISRRGMKSATTALVAKKNYLEVKEFTSQNLSFEHGYVDFHAKPLDSDFHKYADRYYLEEDEGSIVKHADIVARTNQELMNLNMLRQMQSIQIDNFIRDLMTVKSGRVPPSFLPPEELLKSVNDISRIAESGKMNLDHIVKTQEVHKIYSFLTPILVIDTETYEMILLVILPMVPAGMNLYLYHIETLPFMTREGIAMQIVLPQLYYIRDTGGSSHALLSEAEYEKCTLIEDVTICHIAKPIVTVRSECYTALHYEGMTDTTIYESCEFKKVNGRDYHFIYLGPNTFAYFLPKPTIMTLECQGKNYNNMTALPRSGTMSYADRCSATIDRIKFYDTSIEMMDTSVENQEAVLSFLNVARGKWPALANSVADQESLLQAAKDNVGTTEQLASLSTRARMYNTINDVTAMSQEQLYLKEVYNHLFYFLTSLAVPIVLGALYSCYHRIYYKCQPKAHPPIPRPSIIKFKKINNVGNNHSVAAVDRSPTTPKRGIPSQAGTPPGSRKKDMINNSAPTAPNHQITQTAYVSYVDADMQQEIAQFQVSHPYGQLHERPVYT
jgi:hypothetical protein